jgi:hypothetical protein
MTYSDKNANDIKGSLLPKERMDVKERFADRQIPWFLKYADTGIPPSL